MTSLILSAAFVTVSTLVVVAFWWGGLVQWRQMGGRRGAFASGVVQVSLAALLLGLATVPWLGVTIAAFLPALPIIGWLFWAYLSQFAVLLGWMSAGFALGAGVTFIVVHQFAWLRRVALLLSVLAGGIGALGLGEVISQRAMCKAALAKGIGEVQRRSLLFSVRNAPREVQYNLHGAITVDDRLHGWSYREMDWYRLPPTTFGNIRSEEVKEC